MNLNQQSTFVCFSNQFHQNIQNEGKTYNKSYNVWKWSLEKHLASWKSASVYIQSSSLWRVYKLCWASQRHFKERLIEKN